jgi:acyl-CoA synthetase (AMP-forming)/AMP-acid ligase II
VALAAESGSNRDQTFLSLLRLLAGSRPLGHTVALNGDRALSQGDFLRAVGAVTRQALTQGGGRWLLASEDAWDFMTGLFGLLQAGCTVVIPPNHLQATLLRLGQSVDASFTTAECLPEGSPCGELPADAGIEFWTSGSSGEAKQISKTLAQLDAEVRVLETVFGDRFGNGPVRGTVPHHHIYGCLFRVLWPLAAGRAIALENAGNAALLQTLGTGNGDAALVSSPALLSRLPQVADLDALAPVASLVLSSGGPLSPEDALAWRRWVPGGVAEVFGSTETGGVAWRIQDGSADASLWTPFPDVTIAYEADGALRVESPRAGPEAVRMEDAAEPASQGRFALKGRLDRIVKLAEKRVSLPELEASLEASPWVREAALVLLDDARPTLGAAIVLTEEGLAQQAQAPERMPRLLQQHLVGGFESLVIPKRWHFCPALPLDARGKRTVAALKNLFAAPKVETRSMPVVLSHQSGAEEVFSLGLPETHLVFQGHFQDNPILPGVVQVDWAIRLGQQAFGELGSFQAVTHLKFIGIIRPNEPLELRLTLDPDRVRMAFQYFVPSGRKASGVVVFTPS